MGSCCTNGNITNVVSFTNKIEKIHIRRKSIDSKNRLSMSPFRNKSRRSSIYVLNDEIISSTYIFESQLGTGYYGVVQLAIPKNDPNRKYAVKSIDKTKLGEGKLEKIIRETDVLSSVDHPNIIKYHETFNDPEFFHIVMEFCTGGELFERIIKKKYYPEREACSVIYKIASAVSHCHAKGIVHRDLKPENILYESMSEHSDIKIIDFGLSRKISPEEDELHSIVGSPYYVAPEVLEGTYGYECDIWSLGVMMYVLLSGSPPFYSENKVELYYKIKNEQPIFTSKIWNSVSEEAANLIKDMINKNPKKRPKAHKILDHSWFKLMMNGEYSSRQIDVEILNELRIFHQPRKLIKSILTFIVKELKSSDLENLKKTFIIMDKSKTGKIDLGQLKMAFTVSGIEIKIDELKEILTNCAKGGSERINYSSFITAAINKKHILNKQTLWETFKHIDIESSGFINVENMNIALKRTGKVKKIEDLQDMFKEAGLSVGEKINFEDFCKLLQKELD